ncbi:MAG: hypothetical protein ABWW69_02395 [Pyrodictiaceae archaeon]
MATAASSFTGQEIGQGNLREAIRIGWEASKASTIFMALVGGLLVAISPVAPLVFTGTGE